jgi:hypothetical protein
MKLENVRHALWLEGVPPKTIDAFADALRDSPEVWREFERLALHTIRLNKRVGAMAILNKIRWDVEVESSGEWKVNNNWAPYYARAFELKHPAHNGYFEKRAIKGLEAANVGN